jgi:hypothetical protein
VNISFYQQYPKTTALCIYAVIALIANFPVFPGDSTHLNSYTSYDIVQTTWFLSYTPYALLHGHNIFFTNLINYPAGANLAQNTGIPLLGLLTAPLTLLISPVASLNLLRWLAFVFSAYAAYWVFRRIVSWNFAAFIGGLLYGFSPYMVTQGSLHLDLTFVPFPPLIFYALYELFVAQRESARRWGILLGCFVVLQFYISAEVLATTAIVSAIALFYLFFLCIREVPSRIRHLVAAIPYSLLIAAPLLAYPVWFMIHGQAHYTGPAQGYINVFNADLLGPIVFTLAQLIAPRHLAEIGSHFVAGRGDLSENGTYLGIPLLLITTYFICRFWRKLWPLFLGLVAITIFAFSLGPQLIVDGKIKKLPFVLPYARINHLALIENLLPVRFSLYVLFFVATIVVLGIDWVHEDRLQIAPGSLWISQANGGSRLRQGFMWVVTLGAVVTLLPTFPYHSYDLRVNWSESPKGLAIIPRGSRVLTYPYPSVYADTPMLWQALDGMRFKLYGGYVLVPSSTGAASLIPVNHSPVNVEAMLEDSVSPTPALGIFDEYATRMSVQASTIRVIAKHATFHHLQRPTELDATIDSVNTKNGSMIVWVNRLEPILVDTSKTTRYLGRNAQHLGLDGLTPKEHIVIDGTESTGTVDPKTVAQLRTFVIDNRVQSVIVDLGLMDSGEVAHWFRLALGRPTRAGAGGEIWLDTNVKAHAMS